ncbi:MAG TPA: DUF4145 domain-containing protein [Candidatus Angelobacter sp.]
MVASVQGFTDPNVSPQVFIYLCPNCNNPTYFSNRGPVPGLVPGNPVANLPSEILSLYDEARRAVSVASFTAAVLTCRKLLMNVAVAQGAKEGEPFVAYVEYLANKGYVPPNGRGWVDHIRSKGNEANHEIRLMTQAEAEELILFLEMLMKFIYEFPSKVPPAAASSGGKP